MTIVLSGLAEDIDIWPTQRTLSFDIRRGELFKK
jgi:hypothetical protein